MNDIAILPFVAAAASVVLAFGVLLRRRRSVANWLFLLGMVALAVESAFNGASLNTDSADAILHWQRFAMVARSLLPGIWIAFSLTYSRGNYREFLARWRLGLGLAFVVPVTLVLGFHDSLLFAVKPESIDALWQFRFGPAGVVFNLVFMIGVVLMLMNLERTFRAAVGTMRWRIKFAVLGLCVIFGAKIYTSSQALLYSGLNLSLTVLTAGALLIGCALIAASYFRTGITEIDIYPSQKFLYSSITVLVTGVYLVIVGLLAQAVVAMGGDTTFPIKAFLVLIAVVGLAVVLLSDRVRQRTQRFVSRHFKRPLYDYRKVWNLFTQNTSRATDPAGLSAATAKMISETFNILSVSIWLVDEQAQQLEFAASTSLLADPTPDGHSAPRDITPLLAFFRQNPEPVDLDKAAGVWAETLKQYNPALFRKGGHRICVPIVTGEQVLGVILLADRVSGIPFSVEETDILKCIGNHVAAGLLNLQLSEKLMQAKEQEAFKAVSAFFAHDLKNAASSLSLMLQNLPQHFEDPAFREDVLRGLAKNVKHMNHLINRLNVFRQNLEVSTVPANLNDVVKGALSRWEALPGIELANDLQPLPPTMLDPEQIRDVVTNLLLNARDALNQQGQIRIETCRRDGWAVLTVSDNGCGMSAEFMRQSLFRPFQTTKKDGTGIGMFQCKTIVEAHKGRIEVESEPGKGTAFRVWLPLADSTQAAAKGGTSEKLKR